MSPLASPVTPCGRKGHFRWVLTSVPAGDRVHVAEAKRPSGARPVECTHMMLDEGMQARTHAWTLHLGRRTPHDRIPLMSPLISSPAQMLRHVACRVYLWQWDICGCKVCVCVLVMCVCALACSCCARVPLACVVCPFGMCACAHLACVSCAHLACVSCAHLACVSCAHLAFPLAIPRGVLPGQTHVGCRSGHLQLSASNSSLTFAACSLFSCPPLPLSASNSSVTFAARSLVSCCRAMLPDATPGRLPLRSSSSPLEALRCARSCAPLFRCRPSVVRLVVWKSLFTWM